MTYRIRLHRDANFGLDVIIAFILIIALGVTSKLFAASQPENSLPRQQTKQIQLAVLNTSTTIRSTSKTPVATGVLALETPDGSKKIPARTALEQIEVVNPATVPNSQAHGSYSNSAGGIGKGILKNGGKAYKMTFSYTNVGAKDAVYDSGWLLYGQPLEDLIAKQEGNHLTYSYGQVPIWAKNSTDFAYAHDHILHAGQTVTETVWFFPCPQVKECMLGDFELTEPIKISLPQ
ncbi:MAG TPA: hypothetical protein VGK02_01635 [Candidatus Aquicultor sp.]|jgi:hypothetical protein